MGDTTFFSLSFQLIYAFFALLTGKLNIDLLTGDQLQFCGLAAMGIALSIFGAFLLLRRLSMVAGALSHTLLLGVVIAFWILSSGQNFEMEQLYQPATLLLASFITAFLTWGMIALFTRFFHLSEDASIGLVLSSLFALAVLIVTWKTRSIHLGVEVVFGNVDAMGKDELLSSLWIMALSLFFIALFYKRLVYESFDRSFASLVFGAAPIVQLLFLFGVSLALVASFRALGLVVAFGLLVIPYLTLRLLSARLRVIIAGAAFLSFFTSLLSVVSSRLILEKFHLALSTSGLLGSYLLLFFVFALVFRRVARKAFQGYAS